MTYKGARGAVPTEGRGDEYAHGIDSDGQVQVVVNIPVTPF